MPEKVMPGPVEGTGGIREAVCVHTRKIYDSCRDKDCIEDLTFYPTATAQSVIDASQSIRGGRVELLHVGVDVEPVNNGMRATEIEGLATFDKRVMLFGGESRAKVFSSYPVPGGADYPIDLTANLPTAVVTAVDPLLLCARIVDCSCGNCCDCAAVTGVPTGIAEAFDEPILFEPQTRRVCISIGQFSIVRLERGTQLLIPVFDYCIPSGSCQPVGSISCSSCDDPCEMFESVSFPVDDFFPAGIAEGGADTPTNCCSCGGK